MTDPSKRIAKLERIFDAADTAVQTIETDMEGQETYELAPEGFECMEIEEIKDGNVFDLKELKQDFILVKRNLQSLIRRGQNLMQTVDGADVEEMNGSKIMAIAALGTSVAQQLKMITEIYRDITEIEKSRRGSVPGVIEGAVHGDVNQNIIFAGDTASLMKHLRGGK